MLSIFTTTRTQIWGTKDAWSLSAFRGSDQLSHEYIVDVEIQGDEKNGYNLVMSPSGHFTADSWHQTKQDALDAAKELFDVPQDVWSDSPRNRNTSI